MPSGASDLQIEISGGTGDADLYVRAGAPPTLSEYDCRPYIGGNQESCSEPSPEAGFWYVDVRAYETYSDVTLVATFIPSGGGGGGGGGGGSIPDACEAGSAPVSGGGLDAGQTVCLVSSSQNRYFYFWIPSGTEHVTVQLDHGSGNADLRVKSGGWPSTSDYDAVSAGAGTNESITLDAPPSGWFYIAVEADPSHDGVSLVATFDDPGLPPGGVADACASGPGVSGGELTDGSPACIETSTQTRYFYAWVPAGTPQLSVRTANGTGGTSLRVKSGSWPTASDADATSDLPGTAQEVVLDLPPAGWLYIAVNADPSFEGVSIVMNVL
ncbi:MAG: PPC domain-containing protein [Holophagales bacterium]|nr:PPC domain-containing protein [Holophagales bacterium]